MRRLEEEIGAKCREITALSSELVEVEGIGETHYILSGPKEADATALSSHHPRSLPVF